MADDDAQDAELPSPRNGRLLILLLVLAPLGGGAAFGAFSHPPEKTAPDDPHAAEVADRSQESALHEMPELVVNLAGSQGQRYLKIRLAVQLRGQGAEKALKELNEHKVVVRDMLIRLLSAKTIDRVESSDAKEAIKLEVLDLLNRTVFSESPVVAERVFFMEFLIQ
ncbi:MAG: hypothetical protein D6731_20350 [Planctomycetota bacterium]|nr:MAG: hypothetical protein D6731_20350 [Planctomycetota bacterium]